MLTSSTFGVAKGLVESVCRRGNLRWRAAFQTSLRVVLMHETTADKKLVARILAMCLAGAATVVCGIAFPLAPQDAQPQPEVQLDGKLILQPGDRPALRVTGKDYPLSSVRTWYYKTLQDKRLRNRELRVEGEWAPDGTFKVSKFYTVKDSRLYRVRYFCEVCNVEALEPGNCVCCQQPTELQEIPVDANP